MGENASGKGSFILIKLYLCPGVSCLPDLHESTEQPAGLQVRSYGEPFLLPNKPPMPSSGNILSHAHSHCQHPGQQPCSPRDQTVALHQHRVSKLCSTMISSMPPRLQRREDSLEPHPALCAPSLVHIAAHSVVPRCL